MFKQSFYNILRSVMTCVVLSGFCAGTKASDDEYEKALDSFQKGKIDTAYIHLKNVMQRQDVSLPSKILMGRVLLAKGFYSDSIIEFEDALSMNADINLVVQPLAKALLLNKQYQAVLNIEDSSRLSVRSQLELTLLKAAALTSLNQPNAALTSYQKILQQHPNQTRAMNALAALYLERDQLQKAETLIANSLSLVSTDSRTWQVKGQLELKRNKLTKATEAFEMALELSPKDPIAKRALATSLIKQQDYAAALELVVQIVAESPDDPYALMMKSRLLEQQGRFEFAQQVTNELGNRLKQVGEQNEEASASFSLVAGITAYLNREYESARKHLISYQKEVKNNVKAAAMLANTYIALDQGRNALSVLENLEEEAAEHLPIALLLCHLYLQNNKTFKAISLIEILEEKYAPNNRITLMAAKVLTSRGKQNEAIKKIEDYLEFSDDAELQLFRGLLVIERGDLSKANIIARQLNNMEPNNPDFKNFSASVLIKEKRFSEANFTLEEILKQYPEHFSANFNLATLLANQRKFEEAKVIIKQLNNRRRYYLPVRLMDAKISSQTGNYEQAMSQLEDLLALWPDAIEAQELYVEVLIRSQKPQDALNVLNDLLDLSSMNPKYIQRKAEIYLSIKEYDLAKSELKVLKSIWLGDPHSINIVGKLFAKAKALDEAEDAFRLAVSLDSSVVDYKISLARVLLRKENVQEARKLISELSKHNNTNPNIFVLKGDLQKYLNDHWGSHTHYYMAYQLDNTFDLAAARLYQLSQIGIGKETFAQSVSNFLLNNPDHHFQRRLLADHYMIHEQSEDATYQYQKLIDVTGLPHKHEVYNNLATLFLDNDLPKAQDYIDRALQLKNDSWSALDTKGWILAKQGKYQEALEMLRQAYSRKSDSAAVRYHIAYVLVKLSRYDEAKKELEVALATEQTFSEREEAEKLFESI